MAPADRSWYRLLKFHALIRATVLGGKPNHPSVAPTSDIHCN